MLSPPLIPQHSHLINLRLKSLFQVQNSLSRQHKELTLLISFRSRITFQMMAFLENVSVAEVGAFDVGDERDEVRVELSFVGLFAIEVGEDFLFFFLFVDEFVDVDLELDLASFDEVDFFGVVSLLVEDISDQEFQWLEML